MKLFNPAERHFASSPQQAPAIPGSGFKLGRQLHWMAVLAIFAATLDAFPQSAATLKTINNPGGGQVVYGIFDQESSMQGAMVAMLRRVHSNFGERPQIGQFFQSRDGQSVATFFNVADKTHAGKPICGMVIVTMPQGSKPAAAALFDDAKRFNTTRPQLMKRLNDSFVTSEATPAGSSAGTSHNPTAEHQQAAPVPQLQQVSVADNSASISLPPGWQITGGGGGALHATGPKGESIHMGVINQNIFDPNNPKARGMIDYMSKGRSQFFVCPYTNDLAAAYQCVSKQNRQHQHLPAISMHVLSVKDLPAGQYVQAEQLISAEIDYNDGKGPMTCSIRVGAMHQPGAMSWALTVSQVNVPRSLADEEWPTMKAVAVTYRQNGQVIQAQTDRAIAQIQAQGRATQRRIDEHEKQVDQQKADFEAHNDAIDRQSKSFQNYTLDQSVLQDNEYPARGTVSNPTADAYVRANPDRYQIVPQKDWIRGQDY